MEALCADNTLCGMDHVDSSTLEISRSFVRSFMDVSVSMPQSVLTHSLCWLSATQGRHVRIMAENALPRQIQAAVDAWLVATYPRCPPP